MGKALILESLGSGNYRIQYQFNTVLVDERILEMGQSILNYENVEIPAQEAIVVTAAQSVTDASHDLNIAIGSGIVDDMKDKSFALNQANIYLAKQEQELSLLKMVKLNLEKTKTFAEAHRGEPVTVDAWCADFSTEIEGEVGTIETVSSREHPVLIRPAGLNGDQAVFQNTDGQMATPEALSEWGWLYATMLQQGQQKWLSKYRAATILTFHTDDGNICNVFFDPAEDVELGLDLNQQETAYNLPIVYLECNADAFKLGDRVIVEHEEKKGPNGERGVYVPKRVIGFESHPRPCGLAFVIWAGDDTITYNRKYYMMKRGQIQDRGDLDHWDLIDDGKYNIIFTGTSYPDPDDYDYQTTPSLGDGLRVPETDTGRDAKKQDGTTVRFMTNQTLEDELFVAFEIDTGAVIYQYLGQDDSLTRAPYKIKPKASVCRYTTKGEAYNDFGILTFNRILEGGPGGIILTRAWHTNSFGSSLPLIDRGYVKRFDGFREYLDLAAGEPEASSLCCAVGHSKTYSGIQHLIRGEAFTIGIAELAEPLTEQKYNFRDKDEAGYGFVSDEGQFFRSWDDTTNDVYMIDSNTIYGKEIDSEGFTTVSGEQYIKNDIVLPYGITESRKLTYVRKQKNTEFTSHNAGLYVASKQVEESGFQAVISLWGDGEYPADHNGPILIRQLEYRPLQVHHGALFDVVLFRRVVYKSHEAELLSYISPRTVGGDTFNAQVRRTIVTSEIQYAVAVNGKVTELPYKTTAREHRLSVLSSTYSGPSHPVISSYALGPWMDVGFDKNGDPTGEDNSQVTRVFVSESGGNLFVGCDAFPMSCRHDLILGSGLLRPEFDDSVLSYPPYIDLEYAQIKGRKWWVFDTSGTVVEDIDPPSENRINGVCMLDPRG